MPLYELVCIAKTVEQKFLKDLLKQTAFHVMDRDGVVRGFDHLRPQQAFPYRMKAHQQYFESGTYWTMLFDAKPSVLQSLSKQLKLDTRVIRHNVVKMGDKLQDIVPSPSMLKM